MKEPKELGFEFEDVSLREAQALVDAGGGPYSDLVISLIRKIPEIEAFNQGRPVEERKTVSFSPSGKSLLDPVTIKRIQMGINISLKHQGILWMVRYIRKAKAFVCVPKPLGGKNVLPKMGAEIPGGKKKKITSSPFGPAYIALKEKVTGMVKSGKGATEIARTLNERMTRITSMVARIKKELK